MTIRTLSFFCKRALWLTGFFLIVVLSPSTTTARIITSSLQDLPYDENGKLSSHLLVYEFDGVCTDLVETYFQTHSSLGYELRALQGDARNAFFTDDHVVDGVDVVNQPPPTTVSGCRAICVERGVDQSLVANVMPFRHYDGRLGWSSDDYAFDTWFKRSCHKFEVGFMNYLSKEEPIRMYWWNFEDNTWLDRGTLEYGERNTICIETYMGHTFQFRANNASEEAAILYTHTVEYTAMISIGEAPHHLRDDGPDWDYAREVEHALNIEWMKHNSVKRTFSSLGFRKGRLPDDLFASMGAFYYNNRNNKVREEWSGKGFFVNWWETDVYFVQIPWRLKKLWQGRLKDLVEEWVGVSLEQTDMYGLRRYEQGARLLTHVDRRPTHAASLIVNIAQGNVEEPWPVEVHDLQDRLHQVTMEPGDIVYYESAKCLHGRNTPLKGTNAYYVNLFTHYRPTGDPDWHMRDNDPITPPPLGDVGNCWLETKREGNKVARCDNPEIGPWLSPSLFTATSGQDLFQWWKDVGPPLVGGQNNNDEF